MDLTRDQLTALANLARKKAGEDVDWINISAARALTDLGLAERDPSGWVITTAGQSVLSAQAASDPTAPPAAGITPIR